MISSSFLLLLLLLLIPYERGFTQQAMQPRSAVGFGVYFRSGLVWNLSLYLENLFCNIEFKVLHLVEPVTVSTPATAPAPVPAPVIACACVCACDCDRALCTVTGKCQKMLPGRCTNKHQYLSNTRATRGGSLGFAA